MIIQYASDLHIEFPENKEFLKKNPLKPIGETLVLAGDIVPFAVLDKNLDFFSYLSDNFENTYWIPGNHEYYHSDLADKSGTFHEKIMDNVHLLNNTVVTLANIDFIFSTLWTEISEQNSWYIQKHLSDFHVIKYKGKGITPEQYNQIYRDSNAFLKKALHTTNNKSVVVTHHVPTFLNYPEKYKGDVLNEAFAVELFDLIEEYQPEFWMYGHTHGNTDDFRIGKTKLVTNQLGYVKYGEHQLFENDKVFEI
jgi:predicted phosphohydrolase